MSVPPPRRERDPTMRVADVFTPYRADRGGQGRWRWDRDNHGHWRNHHQHWDDRRHDWCDDDDSWRWH